MILMGRMAGVQHNSMPIVSLLWSIKSGSGLARETIVTQASQQVLSINHLVGKKCENNRQSLGNNSNFMRL